MADASDDYRVLVLSPQAHTLLLKLTEEARGLHEIVAAAPTLDAVGAILTNGRSLWTAVRRAAR